MQAIRWFLQAAVLCSAISALAQGQGQTVIFRPREIDDILVNPGMGIQTFQRFNGDPINPGKDWSELGPAENAREGGAKPEFPGSSIAYCRWFWQQLEPEAGRYRWDILDSALERARESGQQLGVRLMPYDQKNPLPEWYRDSGARRANRPEDKDGAVWSPDSSDPLYMRHWGGLVKAFAARYDGHPFLDSVDISTFGY